MTLSEFQHVSQRLDGRAIVPLIVWLTLAMLVPAAWAAERVHPAILVTPHPAYSRPLAEIEAVLKHKAVTYTPIELPKTQSKEPDDEARGDRASTKATTSPAEGPASDTPTAQGEGDPALAKAMKQLTDANPTMIITLGASATAFAIKNLPDKPIVFCMVPNVRDMAFITSDKSRRIRVAGVTSDISPQQQIDWFLKTCPKTRSIGLPYSPHSKLTMETILSAGQARNIAITSVLADKNDFPKTIDTLNEAGCDGVIMIPDANVYSSANVQRLLLWGLQKRKPVWTFSANIVKAGAVAGLYTAPEAVGRQTAELIEKLIGGESISKIGLQYPTQVDIAINHRTAEMIGISFTRQVVQAATAQYGKDD